MKELAKLQITDADPRIKQIPSDELDKKIDLIYSLGYVYNPYVKEFFNPFINQGLKALVVYNLDLDRIQRLHDGFAEEFIEKNNKIRSVDEIKMTLSENDKSSRLYMFLSSESIIFSFLLFIGAVIFNLFGKIEIASIVLSLSLFLIQCFVSDNQLRSKNENENQSGPFWQKYSGLIIIFSILLYPYLYFLLYQIFDRYFLPIVIVVSLRYLANSYITKTVAKRYWFGALWDLVYAG